MVSISIVVCLSTNLPLCSPGLLLHTTMLMDQSLDQERGRPHVLVHEISVVGHLPRNSPVVHREVIAMGVDAG